MRTNKAMIKTFGLHIQFCKTTSYTMKSVCEVGWGEKKEQVVEFDFI